MQPNSAHPVCEDLGQLGQDKPASGWSWSHGSALLLYIGQMSLGKHHRNSVVMALWSLPVRPEDEVGDTLWQRKFALH